MDYLKYLFPNYIFDTMTNRTNLYANQFLENGNIGTYSWIDTSLKEMQTYVAVQIALDINNKPEIPDYWTTYWLTEEIDTSC